jgi:hypothetical protein
MGLVAVGGLALHGLGQTSKVLESGSQVMPVHYTTLPYKAETKASSVQTGADGTIVTGEGRSLLAIDSQGRYVQAGCIERSNPDRSCSMYEYTASDTVAGTQTVWRPSTLQAKVFVYPASVPGRKTCWRVSPEEENVPKGDIPVFLKELMCPPAEGSEGICWRGRVVRNPDDNSPVPAASYKDCLGFFPGTIFQREKILQEKREDLGPELIQGFETHGCRLATQYARGLLVREQWLTRFGPNLSTDRMVLRRLDQFTDSRNGATTRDEVRTTLSLSEPDLATFQPPKDYQIKTVEMHEVPCDELKPPEQ